MVNRVDVGNVRPVEHFYESLSQKEDMCLGQDLRCCRESQPCSFFHAFEIQKESEGRSRGGGRKQGGDGMAGSLTRFCAVLRVMVVAYFQGVFASVHRKNGQGLLQAKINLPLQKSDRPGAGLPTGTCPARHLGSDHAVRRLSTEPLLAST